VTPRARRVYGRDVDREYPDPTIGDRLATFRIPRVRPRRLLGDPTEAVRAHDTSGLAARRARRRLDDRITGIGAR